MISTEMNLKRTQMLAQINFMLCKKFEVCDFDNNRFYKNAEGIYFRVIPFPGEFALVIEYAENAIAAKNGQLEDGDRFYLENNSIDTLFCDMLREIE